MLATARKTINKIDFNQRHLPRGCRNSALSLRMVHKLTRASVTQRLDLIRIRLLRSQLEELYKIKNLLEKKIDEQKQFEEEQRAVTQKLEEQKRQRELEQEAEDKRKLAESEAENEERRRATMIGDAKQLAARAAETYRPMMHLQAGVDHALIRESSREDEENMPPPVYYTPEADKPARLETRCSMIEEEERDDLIPSMKSTPPKSYPRQSIGQWSVERAKNNMSVRSLVTSLEVRVGPKSSVRARMQK